MPIVFPPPSPIGQPPLGPIVIDPHLPPVHLGERPKDFNKWLAANRAISDYIVWERPRTPQSKSVAVPWKDWSNDEKTLLLVTFNRAWADTLPDDSGTPYPNLIDPPDDEVPTTVLAPADAWRHFVESVAVSLKSEIQLPASWSITHLKPAQRAFLLDSRSLYNWYEGDAVDGYYVKPWVLPSRPAYMRRVLSAFHILREEGHRETIVEMIRFCGTLFHFGGQKHTNEFWNHWHYRGYVPVSRVVQGTIPHPSPDHPHQETVPKRWTAGCFGTVGLMEHLLRTVNIPVEKSSACMHNLPHFSSIGRWLSHGNDPYRLKDHPDVDPGALLIDQATYDAWFGPGAADPCANIARRAKEVFGS